MTEANAHRDRRLPSGADYPYRIDISRKERWLIKVIIGVPPPAIK
jgi:hypothetical protein